MPPGKARPLAGMLALLVVSPEAPAVDLVFAHDFLAGSRRIVTYPVATPAAMAQVGLLDVVLAGMDFDPAAGVLWAFNIATQSLGTINQATGAFTPVVAYQGGGNVSAFTIDPVAGKFYVSKTDEFIYELSPTTGQTTTLAQGAPAESQISALAFDCKGRLFAVDGRTDFGNMYQVNFSGNPVLIGFPGLVSARSLEFDNQTGNLYAWFNASGADFSTHARVNPANAQLSEQAVLAGRYRMAIRNVCSAEQLRLFGDGFED